MTGILKIQPSEIITLYSRGSISNARQVEIIDDKGNSKMINVIPSVWEYNNIFLLVAKYNQGVCGILTLHVIGISKVYPA